MNDDFAVWEESYSVGFPPIDDQHKTLVVMINDLFANCREDGITSRAVFARIINEAGEYARSHFSTEEKYLLMAGYPDFQNHKKEHESFMAEIRNEFKKFREGSASPEYLARYLKGWLLNHIAVTDKKFEPYLVKLQSGLLPDAKALSSLTCS